MIWRTPQTAINLSDGSIAVYYPAALHDHHLAVEQETGQLLSILSAFQIVRNYWCSFIELHLLVRPYGTAHVFEKSNQSLVDYHARRSKMFFLSQLPR